MWLFFTNRMLSLPFKHFFQMLLFCAYNIPCKLIWSSTYGPPHILVGWPLHDCMDPWFPLFQTNVVHWLLHQRIHSPGIPVSSENSAYNGSHSAEARPGMFISVVGVNRDPFLHMSHATFLWNTLPNQHGNSTISNVEGTLHTQKASFPTQQLAGLNFTLD